MHPVKTALALFAFLCLALHASSPPAPVSKPMRVYVELDGTLYEAVIAKRGVELGDRADAETHQRFRDEARKYGIAYLQEKIILKKK
jgi:hypothetical protein